jgi:hypothetical protein
MWFRVSIGLLVIASLQGHLILAKFMNLGLILCDPQWLDLWRLSVRIRRISRVLSQCSIASLIVLVGSMLVAAAINIFWLYGRFIKRNDRR